MKSKSTVKLDWLDLKVLHAIQYDFPVVADPYYELAKQLCSTEEVVLGKVRRLQDLGLIRRLGASVNSRRLGFVSTLVALKVDCEFIDSVAEVVNSFRGVTHNYLREGEYNMWFAAIAPTQQDLNNILNNVEKTAGVKAIRSLPATRVFKVSVKFPLAAGESYE